MLGLHIRHIKVWDSYVRLTLPHTKTDQVRTENVKWLPKGSHPDLCPVKAFQEWLARKEVGKKKSNALFPAYRRPWTPISNTTYSENMRMALMGVCLKCITGHGWRSGFASAVLEGGADVTSIQLSGGWAAPTSLWPYVKRSRATKLATEKKAGF